MSAWLFPWTETIGFWAAALTTVSFVPQVVETWRTGGNGMSWWMLVIFGTGVGLWLIYGALRMSAPIMLANGITFAEILLIITLKAWRACCGEGNSARSRL
jgi:MtN3 and saliva related transmembrane protein